LSGLAPALGCSSSSPTTLPVFVKRGSGTDGIWSLQGAALAATGVERAAVTLDPIPVMGAVDAGEWVSLMVTVTIDSSAAGEDRLFAIDGFAQDGKQVASGLTIYSVNPHEAGHANPVTLVPGTCGDGIVDTDTGEACDDGSPTAHCSSTCTIQTTDTDAGAGDGG
jgi:hypothetical protein